MVTDVLSVRDGTDSTGARGLVSTSSDQKKRTQGRRPRTARSVRDSNIGDALRSIYQQTVHEDVPSEMLDLLDKLG
jgi:hypothetical protein